MTKQQDEEMACHPEAVTLNKVGSQCHPEHDEASVRDRSLKKSSEMTSTTRRIFLKAKFFGGLI